MLAMLQPFYDMSGCPYKFATTQSGEKIPVMDRRAFLHVAVFEVKATPQDSQTVCPHIACLSTAVMTD